jgi:hypothetical protein
VWSSSNESVRLGEPPSSSRISASISQRSHRGRAGNGQEPLPSPHEARTHPRLGSSPLSRVLSAPLILFVASLSPGSVSARRWWDRRYSSSPL